MVRLIFEPKLFFERSHLRSSEGKCDFSTSKIEQSVTKTQEITSQKD